MNAARTAPGLVVAHGPAPGEDRFRELADFAPVMIWRAGTDTHYDWFNKPWLDFTGRSLHEEVGDGWAGGLHPDDVERCLGHYASAFAAHQPFAREYRLRRHDGAYRWLLDHGAPFERDGEFAGYFGSCVDITALHEAGETQRLLVDELDHRVKNMLGVVQALARQSFRAPGAAVEARAFDARVAALAKAHDILTRAAWRTVSLRDILDETIGAWCGDDAQFTLAGPMIPIAPKAAVTLSIAVHELCTNAVHHGALSVPEGRVAVDWHVLPGHAASDGQDSRDSLALTWRERGGPDVTAPAADARGFGTRMLERALASELGGHVQLCFEREGLECRITAPMASLARAA